ncbi:MAG: hypothetical protein OIN90_01575 [Candidatus Methanoperedens sp.]|nr:hypothetical protein [Candidatus Methanoperedens sp.]
MYQDDSPGAPPLVLLPAASLMTRSVNCEGWATPQTAELHDVSKFDVLRLVKNQCSFGGADFDSLDASGKLAADERR